MLAACHTVTVGHTEPVSFLLQEVKMSDMKKTYSECFWFHIKLR